MADSVPTPALVSVNGVQLEVRDAGDGVPVVFSHGGASDVRYWDPQHAEFASAHRFVAYSRRCHGASACPVSASAEDHADDLIALVRHLDTGPVHLVGFSAATALHIASREPALLRSLTVIEPNAPSLLTDDAADAAALERWRSETERLRQELSEDPDLHAERWFELVNNRGPGTFADQPPPFREMWLANFAARRSPSRGPELDCARLGAITAPTLVVGAEHGMTYSRRIVERVAQCVPHSRMLIVPDVTHFMSYQAPSVFNRAVLVFLATT